MENLNLGDKLYDILNVSIVSHLKIGEFLQLSYNAFELMAKNAHTTKEAKIKIQYPIGLTLKKEQVLGEAVYTKEIFLNYYNHLATHDLPKNGIYQLVSNVENTIGECLKEILLQFPKKLGRKRNIPLSAVLEASTLKDVHLTAISTLLNELNYQSPKDFAESISDILSFNLIEIPHFYRFIEIKATRDIYIHNRGVANSIYTDKAGSHARVEQGEILPIDNNYFLESYEACLKLNESLIKKFHDTWPSDEYIKSRKK